MNPSTLKLRLTACVENRLPVLIKGAPGVGKTDIVTQVANDLKMKLILFHPVVSDPTDFKGLPGIVKGKAEFLPFGDLRVLLECEEPTLAFYDDVGQAPACVQAALMQLILANQVNGHILSEHVVHCAATNRREDRAGVTGILEPVKSRFATILELIADVDDWVTWALHHEMPPELIGFVHFRPALLTSGKATNDIINHPCPRTFANAGRLINSGLTDLETLAGAVGEGCASEMVGFIKVYKQLPNLSAILTDPKNATVPDEPAALYAVVSGLTEKVTEQNFSRVNAYGNRLPQDFSILLVRNCIRKEPKIQNTKAFIEWALLHKNVLTA